MERELTYAQLHGLLENVQSVLNLMNTYENKDFQLPGVFISGHRTNHPMTFGYFWGLPNLELFHYSQIEDSWAHMTHRTHLDYPQV
jgi:hypothetical protein